MRVVSGIIAVALVVVVAFQNFYRWSGAKARVSSWSTSMEPYASSFGIRAEQLVISSSQEKVLKELQERVSRLEVNDLDGTPTSSIPLNGSSEEMSKFSFGKENLNITQASDDLDEAPASSTPPKGSSEEKSDFSLGEEDLDMMEANGCVPLEHVCIAGNQWFYGSGDGRNDRVLRQPTIQVHTNFHSRSGYPSSFILDKTNSTMLHGDKTNADAMCSMSPVSNHIVLTGHHLPMMMEFLHRVVYPWYNIWFFLTAPWWKNPDVGRARTSHVQFYIHFGAGSKLHHEKLGSSMPLFMQAFAANPLASLLHLWDVSGPECQCYRTLSFCGYSNTPSESLLNVNEVKAGKMSAAIGKNYTLPELRSLARHHIRDTVVSQNPVLRREMKKIKEAAVQRVSRQTVLDETTNLTEWTLVGFAQRTGRRRWLNLDRVLRQCNNRAKKIACIEVNNDAGMLLAPLQQVVHHAALDAFIGVHGSQQAHQVWLPEYAVSLEILPHVTKVPDRMFGSWARGTSGPTPNAALYTSADLNHYGYPLTNSSLVNCSRDYPRMPDCNEDEWWGTRDFVVPEDAMRSFVSTFVVRRDNELADNSTRDGSPHVVVPNTVSDPIASGMTFHIRSCEYYEEHSMDDFVLYNINCWDSEQNKVVVKHWYRKRSSFPFLEGEPYR